MDTDYLKRVGIGILSALVALGIVMYLGYHIWRSVTREVETQPVSSLTTTRAVETDGYIFRSETPVFATVKGGSIVLSAAEGENIHTGGTLANVYSGSSPDTLARLSEIEEQLSLLEEIYNTGDGSSSLKDSVAIDRDIYGALTDIRSSVREGNALEALSHRSSFLVSVKKRDMLTGSSTGIEENISALKSEKSSLISGLGSCLESIYNPVSGYFYGNVDGYEKIFDPKLLSDITYDELDKLLAAAPEDTESNAVGKTVTSAKWYLVCRLDRKYLNIYKTGDLCNVNFKSNGKTVEMTVENVLDGGDEAAFVLSTRVMPRGFDYTRIQSVELTEDQYTGLRVPVGAVRVVNGETGVYILEGSTVRFRKISVLYRSEGVCIVDADPDDGADDESDSSTPWLRLHDNVIVKGKGLYDGRVIGS